MFDKIKVLIRESRVVPTSLTSFRALLPEADSADMLPVSLARADLESIAGVGCILNYRDAGGEESNRRVTCRRLNRIADALYLQALCHERGAQRTFRIDRIVEVACGVTGKVHRPSDPYFARYIAQEGDASSVGFFLGVKRAADLRAGLNVLAFLARADGKVVPEEREVIAEFCRSFAVRYGNDRFAHEGACGYADRLAPDAEQFYVALERLTVEGAPQGLARLVADAANRLISADGVQHEREFYYGAAVQDYLAAA